MKYEESDYEAGLAGSWIMSFILGGLIGAAVALLVAPKSGRQTREQIKDMAQDAKERAEDYYDQARDKIHGHAEGRRGVPAEEGGDGIGRGQSERDRSQGKGDTHGILAFVQASCEGRPEDQKGVLPAVFCGQAPVLCHASTQ